MDPFVLKLFLSVVVGGVWITVASMAAERFGSRVGGLIAGLPSTVVVALFFIAWTQGPAQAHSATDSTPLGFALNSAYAVAFAAASPWGLVPGLAAAFTAWFGLQGVLMLAGTLDFGSAIAVWIVTVFAGSFVVQRVMGVRAQSGVQVRYSAAALAARGLFAGLVIASAVALSRLAGPVWGGMFAAFPAVFTSTLVIVSRSAGVRFARSMMLSLLLAGGTIPVVYVIVFRLAILHLGLVESMVLAYAASLPGAVLMYLFMRRWVR